MDAVADKDKELGQFWPCFSDGTLSINVNFFTIKLLLIIVGASGERGPIELPDGSKRNWAGNQVYTPAYEESPTNKEEVKMVC